MDTSAPSARGFWTGRCRRARSRFGIGDSKYHYSQQQELVDHIPFGAYTTELARAIGGWDEELRTNEDYDFRFSLPGGRGRLLRPGDRRRLACPGDACQARSPVLRLRPREIHDARPAPVIATLALARAPCSLAP